MREWADAYLLAKRHDVKPLTLKKIYGPSMRSWCDYCDARGLHHIEAVEPDDVRRWIVSLQEHGDSPAYVHMRFRTIRNFFRWWGDEAATPTWRNPMRNVKPPRVPEKVVDPVDGDLVRTLFRDANVRDRAILIVLFTGGLRASELLALDLDDFDRASGVLLVRHGKGGKVREVPLPQKARKAVRQWLAIRPANKSDALFTTYKEPGRPGGPIQGERMTYWGLREITRRMTRKHGLNDTGLHSFRHAAALGFVRAYVPETMIAQIFGWSPGTASKMLRVYAKTTTADRQDAVDRAGLDKDF